MILNLTQRQACESISQSCSKNMQFIGGWVQLLTMLYASDEQPLTISTKDAIDYGLIRENFSYGRLITFDNLNSSVDSNGTGIITVRTVDETWVEANHYTSIIDAVHAAGYQTLRDALGSNFAETITSRGFSTIDGYFRGTFDYYVEETHSILAIIVGDTVIRIADVKVDAGSGTVLLTPILSETDNEGFTNGLSALCLCYQTNDLFASVAQALAANTCTPADLSAVLQRFTNSKWGAIREYANSLIGAGSAATQQAISNFISIFRNAQNFSENPDGTLTWITNGTSVETSAWMVVGQIISGLANIVGAALLFAGGVIGKIVGGALMVASSIFSAVASFTGQVTGTAPYINDDAVDDVYADPLFQGRELLPLANLSNALDTLENLKSTGRAKVVADFCVVYMYNANFDISPDAVQVDYKIFPRLRYRLHWKAACYPKDVWSYSSQVFDGYQYYFSSTPVTVNYSFPKAMQWPQTMSSDIVPAGDLSSTSANADDWIPLWLTLRDAINVTLTTVFSSGVLQYHAVPTIITSVVGEGCCNVYQENNAMKDLLWALRDVGSYGTTSSHSTGADDFVSYIGKFLRVSTEGLNILYSCLTSLGVLDVTQDDITAFGSYHLPIINIPTNTYIGLSDVTFFNKCFTDSGYSFLGVWNDGWASLPFVVIDKHSYVTPQSHSYRALLWGAIICAAVITAVATSMVIVRKVLAKKTRFYMQRKGQDLLREGEVFRVGWTQEEWDQLSDEDKADYTTAWKRYNFKVNIYNAAANFLGLSTLDWTNSWWSEPSQLTSLPLLSSTANSNIPELLNTEAGKVATYNAAAALGLSTDQGFSDTDGKLNLVLKSITGVTPQ